MNDSIQAADDTAETNDEDAVTIDVLANETDVDTDPALNKDTLHQRSEFSITAVGIPEHGAAKIASGKITYTPDDRFAGRTASPIRFRTDTDRAILRGSPSTCTA